MRMNNSYLQSVRQLEWPTPIQFTDVDAAEPALSEPLLAAGMGNEVLVFPKLCQLHHRAVVEVLQLLAQRGEGVHAGLPVAQLQHAHCHLAKLTEKTMWKRYSAVAILPGPTQK